MDLSGIPVLRVFALNTLFKPPTEHRWSEIAAWVTAEMPDVIFLQECREEDGHTVASWLAATLGDERSVVFGGVDDDEGRRSGNAILSRWPIEHHEQFLLECDDV